jgi:hypothetical protein
VWNISLPPRGNKHQSTTNTILIVSNFGKKNADEKSPFQPKVQVLLLLMDLLFFVGRKIKYYDTFEISSGSSFFTSSEWDLSKERERERKREGKATRKAADSRATCERDG